MMTPSLSFRSLLIISVAWAASAMDPPVTYVLKTELNTWDVEARDLNGDGNLEIIALTCDEKSFPLKKQLELFIPNEAGTYPSAPNAKLALDSKVGVCLFAQVDKQAPPELVAADSFGAKVFSFRNNRFEQTSEPVFASLLPTGAKEPVFYKTGAVDLDGDGRDEWLIPVPSAYSVRTPEGELAVIPCDVSSNLRDGTNLYISHRLPQLTAFSVPGEPRKSLTFLSDEFADFAHGDHWSQHSRFKIPLNLEGNWDSQAIMKDVDNNGLPDLLVTQTKGTLNVTVLTQVYLASAPYTYSEKPTAAYSVTGSFASPLLVDVDGDKNEDLVFIKVPYGLKLFTNFLLRHKVNVVAEVHLFSNGGFRQEPDYESNLTIDAPEGRQKVAYTLGDFTGDGRKDAAFGMGKEKMAIYVGSPGQFLDSKPAVQLDIPAFGEARTHRLNKNQADDIVLFHPAGQDGKRIEVVVF
jgi:hypothetical protein